MNISEKVYKLNELLARANKYFSISSIGNITLNEISSLNTVIEGGEKKGSDLTMKEAGELLELGPSATSQLAARLERKGLLTREFVLWDRRKTLVRPTEKGKKLIQKLAQDRIKCIECAINILGEEKTDEFIELFKNYMDAIEEGDKCSNSEE